MLKIHNNIFYLNKVNLLKNKLLIFLIKKINFIYNKFYL